MRNTDPCPITYAEVEDMQAEIDRLRAENEELRHELNALADSIMSIDGDRDHMAQSNLTCEQTQSVARYLRRLAAAKTAKEDDITSAASYPESQTPE